eukprot:1274725-Lingulodinium_polyedra.AAC.1
MRPTIQKIAGNHAGHRQRACASSGRVRSWRRQVSRLSWSFECASALEEFSFRLDDAGQGRMPYVK